MGLAPQTEKVELRFAPYIEELHAFFASHGMHFGAPEDLQCFSERLRGPGPFSHELSSMVRSVIFRERGNVPRSELFALVATSIGGPTITQPSVSTSQPVTQLADFIAGVVRAPQNEPLPFSPIHFDEAATDDSSTSGKGGAEAAHESSATSTGGTPAEGASHPPRGRDGREEEDAYLTSDWQEALQRIESKSLEFRLSLDAIDERVRKIEPKDLLSKPPVDAEAPTPEPTEVRLPHFNTDLSAGRSDEWVQRCLRIIKEFVARAGWGRISWLKHPGVTAKGWIIGGAALVVLVAGFLVWQSPATSRRDGIAPEGIDGAFSPGNQTGSMAAKPTPYGKNIGRGTTPTSTRTDASQPAPPFAPRQSTDGGERGPAASPYVVGQGQPLSGPSVGLADGQPGATYASRPSQSPYGLSNPDRGRTRTSSRVVSSSGRPGQQRSLAFSSGVMAGNLIYAPPPSYPRLASFAHVQGEVLLQAIVSRDGKIANLHVVRGPRLLRGAAASAVHKWRYRPYVINGRAVAVSTIVTVDFELGR